MLELDAYVVDTLMPDLVGHDRHASAFLVFLYLWRQSGAGPDRFARSLNEIAEGTGLSRRSVQSAIARLKRRRLIRVGRPSQTSVSEFEVLAPWRGAAVRPAG